MCEISLSDSLFLEKLHSILGKETTCGANILTAESVGIKNGIGVVLHVPVSCNDAKSVFGWVTIDKKKFKRIKFNNNCFKFRKNLKRFNGNVEIYYCYYDKNAKSIEILSTITSKSK